MNSESVQEYNQSQLRRSWMWITIDEIYGENEQKNIATLKGLNEKMRSKILHQ